MKTILYILLLVIPSLTYSQSKPQPIRPYSKEEVKEAKGTAEDYMRSQNYSGALVIYQRLVVTEPNNADFNYKLGFCYLSSNIDKSKAVSYMEYAAEANIKSRPKDVLFDLGRSYHYAGMYDKALETYEKYRTEKKGTIDAKLGFDRYVAWSVNAKDLVNNPVTSVFENLGKTINSVSADYRPIISSTDSIVYFSSKRKGSTGGLVDDLGDFPSDVYFFTQNDTSRSKVKNAGPNVNTPFYEETCFITSSGDKMLVYRESPESNGDIYIGVLNGKQYEKLVNLGKDFITKTLETGACYSPDGLTLYFSAEMEGSKTGKDIYKCTRTETTSWSKPERLGDNINTLGDEDFPLMWIDGKTFFFSSTGRNSMGGYDVFRATLNSENEGFTSPTNIGYPLNSAYDDMNIAVAPDGKTCYIGAVRDSGLGDFDIYKVLLAAPITNSQLVYVSGITITAVGGPAKGAFVVVTKAGTGETVANLKTNDATGRFDLALPDGNYKISLRHPKLGKADADLTVDSTKGYKTSVVLTFP
jgi:hypothetical protein